MTELEERGFVVIPGPIPADRMDRLAAAYDAALAAASSHDIKVGSTSTRVNDFVNRGTEFDDLYVFPPLLEACRHVIGKEFRLSSLHARSLHPEAFDQGLHVDVRRDSVDWPLVGFILMVDAFRPDNGATRFVPGSHRGPRGPDTSNAVLPAGCAEPVAACGAAGSLLIFNGSAWHGHGPNPSGATRRSLQGAFIPRDGRAGTDFAARMQPGTRARLSPLAKYLLAI